MQVADEQLESPAAHEAHLAYGWGAERPPGDRLALDVVAQRLRTVASRHHCRVFECLLTPVHCPHLQTRHGTHEVARHERKHARTTSPDRA
jgi:hypothetical protein